ncbi:hypothetical protein ACOJCM_01025 [Billgrantia sp. LNSP4103-1]|uniref:hypothetical protein n=1 Tax=Billgrantia sp. LNSP4103-1 TaxID=3410266 RepID=UPI00403F1DD0
MVHRWGLLSRLGTVLIVLHLVGCTARVLPPDPPTLTEPVDVFLIDHGRHSSLVLPYEGGGYVRYSYGDWRWYVEGRRHLAAGAAAMFWPTHAGLGRGTYPQGISRETLRRLAPEGLEAVYPLKAEASRVRALRRRLDGHFERADSEPIASEEYGLEFVPHSRRYSALHQSNLVVAGWLRELGFDVRGASWLSRWRVDPPPVR